MFICHLCTLFNEMSIYISCLFPFFFHTTKFIFILSIKELKPYQKRVKDMNQVLSMKSMHRYSLQDSSTQELELLKDVDMTHQ